MVGEGKKIHKQTDLSSFQFHNGRDSTSPLLGNESYYCGSQLPSIPESSSNYVTLTFISDALEESHGFKLRYQQQCMACGGHLNLSDELNSGKELNSGYLTSPRYPDNYLQNMDCTWVITVPTNELVQAEFLEEFSIGGHSK